MSMKQLLHAALFTPLRPKDSLMFGEDGQPIKRVPSWGLPMLFMAEPGTAKTSIVNQTGREYALPVLCLSPGTHGEGAFGVTPVPFDRFVNDVKRMFLGFPPPEYIIPLLNGGIIFLDEITTAPPALQPPMLGFIQERKVGFYEFHPRVRVLGAGNPVGLSAGGYELSAPVANRLGWMRWTPPTADEWADWLMGEGASLGNDDGPVQDAQAEEARVLAAWPTAFAKWSALFGTFVRRRGMEVLLSVPPVGDPKLSGPWPSHRTMEYACRAAASCDVHGLGADDRDLFIESFVGAGVRDELNTFIEKLDLPDAAGVLDGTVPFKHDPRRLDVTYVVLQSCATLVTPAKAAKRTDRANKLWEIIGETDEAGAPDVTEPFAAALTRAGLHTLPAAQKVLAKEADLLRRAGRRGR